MRKKMWKRLPLLLTAAFLLSSGGMAGAQEAPVSYPSGLYLGADIIINVPEGDLRGDFEEVDPGAGFNLKIGYNFPIHLALEAELGVTGHQVQEEDAGIGFFVIALRYSPVSIPGRPLYPYVRVGVGSYALVIDHVQDGFGRTGELELTGKGVDFGIGFDYYLNSHVGVSLGVTQRYVRYDEIDFLDFELAKDVKGPMTSLSLGAKYHF